MISIGGSLLSIIFWGVVIVSLVITAMKIVISLLFAPYRRGVLVAAILAVAFIVLLKPTMSVIGGFHAKDYVSIGVPSLVQNLPTDDFIVTPEFKSDFDSKISDLNSSFDGMFGDVSDLSNYIQVGDKINKQEIIDTIYPVLIKIINWYMWTNVLKIIAIVVVAAILASIAASSGAQASSSRRNRSNSERGSGQRSTTRNRRGRYQD